MEVSSKNLPSRPVTPSIIYSPFVTDSNNIDKDGMPSKNLENSSLILHIADSPNFTHPSKLKITLFKKATDTQKHLIKTYSASKESPSNARKLKNLFSRKSSQEEIPKEIETSSKAELPTNVNALSASKLKHMQSKMILNAAENMETSNFLSGLEINNNNSNLVSFSNTDKPSKTKGMINRGQKFNSCSTLFVDQTLSKSNLHQTIMTLSIAIHCSIKQTQSATNIIDSSHSVKIIETDFDEGVPDIDKIYELLVEIFNAL